MNKQEMAVPQETNGSIPAWQRMGLSVLCLAGAYDFISGVLSARTVDILPGLGMLCIAASLVAPKIAKLNANVYRRRIAGYALPIVGFMLIAITRYMKY